MTHRRPTPGKVRRLQTASSPAGVFRVLAIDHRGVLLKMMDRNGLGSVSAGRVTELKLDVVRHLGSLATAVILDPEYGVLQAIACGALHGTVGLLSSLDGEPRAESSADVGGKRPAWSVRRARQVGACGVKLYLSYHPETGDRARAQEELVRDIVNQCAEEAMPLFLEPVVCSIDPDAPVGSPQFAQQRRQLTIDTVRRLGALGPDVLKLQFPVDGHHEPDEAQWQAACVELNDASPVPWALLSAGQPFEMFKTQLQIACEAGCSGFMAGRAVWSEAAKAAEGERDMILEKIIRPRMEELNRIATRYGHGWQEKCPLAGIDLDWSESS
jgi:tagatose 1,6-diphosphate aldolase